MTFDQTVLIWCVLTPALITLASVGVACFVRGGPQGVPSRQRLATAIVAVGWCVAVWISVSVRQDWGWRLDEAWQQGLWPVLGWALWTACWDERSGGAEAWIVAGLLATWTAAVAMPTGENWEDTFGHHRDWMVAITISGLLNARAIHRLSARGAERWVPLVALATLGGPTILAASAYASLTEFGIAAIAATTTIALVALAGKGPRLALVSLPVVALAASLVAAGRFYSYEEHPPMIYGAMLLLPTWVAVADWPIRDRSSWIRVVIAALVSATVVVACLWFILLRETESW